MPRMYSEEEKQIHLDSFKVSGKSQTAYARENNIPEATFRAWIKDDCFKSFGSIDINPILASGQTREIKPLIIFSCDNIRIELKEGFDRALLRKIVGVLIND